MLLSVRIQPRSSMDPDLMAQRKYNAWLTKQATLAKNALPKLDPRQRTSPGKYWSQEDQREVFKLHLLGYSIRQIAECYSALPNTCNTIIGRQRGLIARENYRA